MTIWHVTQFIVAPRVFGVGIDSSKWLEIFAVELDKGVDIVGVAPSVFSHFSNTHFFGNFLVIIFTMAVIERYISGKIAIFTFIIAGVLGNGSLMIASYHTVEFGAGASAGMFGLIAVAGGVGVSSRSTLIRVATILVVGEMVSRTIVGVYQRFVLKGPEMVIVAEFGVAHLAHLIGFVVGCIIVCGLYNTQQFNRASKRVSGPSVHNK